jgi:hypothetical protein
VQKIPSVFMRNYDTDRLCRDEVVPGCEWVLAGEGVATRKYDGTCCLVRDGRLYKRYEVKPGGKAPPNFEPAGEVDETTGKVQGWVPVGDGPEDRWHREGLSRSLAGRSSFPLRDGTYELIGPKVQGNPEKYADHFMIPHDAPELFPDCPRTFAALRDWLATKDIEGVVFHHPDGRMAKVKKKDFGLKRAP